MVASVDWFGVDRVSSRICRGGLILAVQTSGKATYPPLTLTNSCDHNRKNWSTVAVTSRPL